MQSSNPVTPSIQEGVVDLRFKQIDVSFSGSLENGIIAVPFSYKGAVHKLHFQDDYDLLGKVPGSPASTRAAKGEILHPVITGSSYLQTGLFMGYNPETGEMSFGPAFSHVPCEDETQAFYRPVTFKAGHILYVAYEIQLAWAYHFGGDHNSIHLRTDLEYINPTLPYPERNKISNIQFEAPAPPILLNPKSPYPYSVPQKGWGMAKDAKSGASACFRVETIEEANEILQRKTANREEYPPIELNGRYTEREWAEITPTTTVMDRYELDKPKRRSPRKRSPAIRKVWTSTSDVLRFFSFSQEVGFTRGLSEYQSTGWGATRLITDLARSGFPLYKGFYDLFCTFHKAYEPIRLFFSAPFIRVTVVMDPRVDKASEYVVPNCHLPGLNGNIEPYATTHLLTGYVGKNEGSYHPEVFAGLPAELKARKRPIFSVFVGCPLRHITPVMTTLMDEAGTKVCPAYATVLMPIGAVAGGHPNATLKSRLFGSTMRARLIASAVNRVNRLEEAGEPYSPLELIYQGLDKIEGVDDQLLVNPCDLVPHEQDAWFAQYVEQEHSKAPGLRDYRPPVEVEEKDPFDDMIDKAQNAYNTAGRIDAYKVRPYDGRKKPIPFEEITGEPHDPNRVPTERELEIRNELFVRRFKKLPDTGTEDYPEVHVPKLFWNQFHNEINTFVQKAREEGIDYTLHVDKM